MSKLYEDEEVKYYLLLKEGNEMATHSWKRLSFVAVLLMLSGWLMVLPTARGAVGATDKGSAPAVGPGVYPNEMRLGAETLYYNVSCTVGANLTAILTWESTNCSEVAILAPDDTILDSDMGSGCACGMVIASVICASNQNYTIRVGPTIAVKDVKDVALKDISVFYTLIICLDGDCGQAGGIPGFDLLVVCFGLMTLMGLVLLWSRWKKISL